MSVFDHDQAGPPPLDRRQQYRLQVALRDWVERIRFPDRPLIAYQGLGFASPRELLWAVSAELEGRESELGQRYLESVRVSLTEIPFDVFIASIERSGRPRSRILRLLLEASARISFQWRREPGGRKEMHG
jgi:hypothetical protein